jgi:hypothetical protein
MQNTDFIFAGVGISFAIIALVVYKKSKTVSSTNSASSSNITGELNIAGNKLQKEEDKKTLTLQERIELSWKFLYEITELVINRFSRDDINYVNELGRILLNKGMRYEHVVDLGIKQSISKVKTIEQVQSGQSLGK